MNKTKPEDENKQNLKLRKNLKLKSNRFDSFFKQISISMNPCFKMI